MIGLNRSIHAVEISSFLNYKPSSEKEMNGCLGKIEL